MHSISIIIPTLNAAHLLAPLADRLWEQTVLPLEILVIDSSSDDETVSEAQRLGLLTSSIPRADFNHGGTRNMAARQASGDILVFLTQDALPADRRFLEELVKPIVGDIAVATFARQIPYPSARPTEVFARTFNYPDRSELRTKKDRDSLGIRTYFFSNVSSAIKKDVFFQEGMFRSDVIMNEDMLFCAHIINSGLSIMYCADSRVYHSHNYTLFQTFNRYFDIGVFYSRHLNQLIELKVNATGSSFFSSLIFFLIKNKYYKEILYAISETSSKFFGFYSGRFEKFIPLSVKKRISLHKSYWNNQTHKYETHT